MKKQRSFLKSDTCSYVEYKKCISYMIQNEIVRSMEQFKQHGGISCLEHSINVSYNSYFICRHLGLDYQSAARGGLLHDLFLYDWHTTKQEKGLHGFSHPYIALENATKIFVLNEIEIDIIKKHMWPLTIVLPKYKESLVVMLVDKYCALMEMMGYKGVGRSICTEINTPKQGYLI